MSAIWAILCTTLAITSAANFTPWLLALGWAPLIFMVIFFRDPHRHPPREKNVVVAPADGKIIEVAAVKHNEYYDEFARKISIFMSPLNVHINRIPIGGVIEKLLYNRGKFLTAFHPKASRENEQQFISIKTSCGTVGCVQIAGWLARRIVCHLHEGQQVSTGERFGMIRFGSRVDLYLPDRCNLQVRLGQRVRAAETIIGVFDEKE